jgi:DNA repair exonuclease SbcCD ATPase subunit
MLMAISLIGAGSLLYVAKQANNSLDKDLKMTKSNADSLSKLSGSLQNKVDNFKAKGDSLTVKNESLQKSLTQTNSRLTAQRNDYNRVQKTVDDANKKYNELMTSQKDQDKQLANYKAMNGQLEQENKNLMSKVASLNDVNRQLTDQLGTAKTMAKDNILIETMTKGGKLNLKGKRVRKIVASLDMQREMKNPTFRIFDPNGVLLPDQVGSFDLKYTNQLSSNQASINALKIELTYLMSKKIGSGLYRIEMLNENHHVGNLLVRFR